MLPVAAKVTRTWSLCVCLGVTDLCKNGWTNCEPVWVVYIFSWGFRSLHRKRTPEDPRGDGSGFYAVLLNSTLTGCWCWHFLSTISTGQGGLLPDYFWHSVIVTAITGSFVIANVYCLHCWNAFTLMIGHQEERPACKIEWWGAGGVIYTAAASASEVEAVVQSPRNMAAAKIVAVDFNKMTSKWRHSTGLLVGCGHVCWGRSASQSTASNASAVMFGHKKFREYLL